MRMLLCRTRSRVNYDHADFQSKWITLQTNGQACLRLLIKDSMKSQRQVSLRKRSA